MEIQMYRGEIRKCGILSDPTSPKPLVSMEGLPLHKYMINFWGVTKSNHLGFLKNPAQATFNKVFVADNEEQAL